MTRLLLSLVVAAAFAAPVAAQPAPTKPDVSALEESGFKHYRLAEYDAAIVDFKEAYRLSEEPAFLYNIAQAYRMKNECREAATFYKNYLHAATEKKGAEPPNAAKVRTLVAEMEACAAKQPATTTTPTTTTTTTPPPETTPPPTTTATTEPIGEPVDEPEPVASSKPKWMKWAGIAGIGVGALGVGLSMKFALDGQSANDDLKEKCATSCTSEEALSIESDGKAANRNALISGIAGGAVLAGGVVLLVLSLRDGGEEAEPSASLELTPRGASASYAWRF